MLPSFIPVQFLDTAELEQVSSLQDSLAQRTLQKHTFHLCENRPNLKNLALKKSVSVLSDNYNGDKLQCENHDQGVCVYIISLYLFETSESWSADFSFWLMLERAFMLSPKHNSLCLSCCPYHRKKNRCTSVAPNLNWTAFFSLPDVQNSPPKHGEQVPSLSTLYQI